MHSCSVTAKPPSIKVKLQLWYFSCLQNIKYSVCSFRVVKLNDIDKREQPTLARLNSLSVDDVIRVVGEYFNLKKTDTAFRKQLQEIDRLLHKKSKAKVCPLYSLIFHSPCLSDFYDFLFLHLNFMFYRFVSSGGSIFETWLK